MEVKNGDVFLAHNKAMTPPKTKFHLCINQNLYFIINTKAHNYNCEITPNDCSLLSYASYIDCGLVMSEPISNFKIIKKEELSKSAIGRLIEKVKCCPVLIPVQAKKVIEELEKVL